MHARVHRPVVCVHTVTTIRTSSVLLACVTNVSNDDTNGWQYFCHCFISYNKNNIFQYRVVLFHIIRVGYYTGGCGLCSHNPQYAPCGLGGGVE